MRRYLLIIPLLFPIWAAVNDPIDVGDADIPYVTYIEEPQRDVTKIDVASQFLGFSSRTHRKELRDFMGIDPVRIDWCAAFVNAVLAQVELPGSDTVSQWPLTARSFLRWGKRVRDPQPGDIVVFPRGTEPWQGHVGFYYGTVYKDGKKYYQILGGNQGDGVSIELFAARSAIAIRRIVDV
jgi:uncharacterized protein (TIGR02594 family)